MSGFTSAKTFWSKKPNAPKFYQAHCDFTPKSTSYVVDDTHATTPDDTGHYSLVIMSSDGHVFSCHSEKQFEVNDQDQYIVNTDDLFMTPMRTNNYKDLGKKLLNYV